MTNYEKGFLAKCAEYGVDGRRLLKLADRSTYMVNYRPDAIYGALLGGAAGAITGKKGNRLKRALIGSLLGGSAGVGARYLLSGKTIRDFSKYKDEVNKNLYDQSTPVKDERVGFAADFTASGKKSRDAWARVLKDIVDKKALVDVSNKLDDGSHAIVTAGNEPWRKNQQQREQLQAEQWKMQAEATKAWGEALKKVMGDKAFSERFPDGVNGVILPNGVDREAVMALMPEQFKNIWGE